MSVPKTGGGRKRANKCPNGPQGIGFRLRPGAALGDDDDDDDDDDEDPDGQRRQRSPPRVVFACVCNGNPGWVGFEHRGSVPSMSMCSSRVVPC